tara:strand:+ start:540 stop:764 length:225 start_codon:yes stop_codon:yes gene_type:complete
MKQYLMKKGYTDRFWAAVWLPGFIGLFYLSAWLFSEGSSHHDILAATAMLTIAGYALAHRLNYNKKIRNNNAKN